MNQEWKKILVFTDYEVSNDGKIRSCDRMKEYRSGRKMTLTGKRKTVYPHKVVAIVFFSNDKPRKKKVVMHIDGNTENNHVENLNGLP
jgi:hypothetical protein